MEILDMTVVKLAAGLLLLIAANIALGSINAIIAGTWDLVKFRNGCIKSLVIAAALIAVYLAGFLNPDLMVVDVDGQKVNLMTAVTLTMLAAFTVYAVDVIKKLKDMLTTPTPGEAQTSRTSDKSFIESDETSDTTPIESGETSE